MASAGGANGCGGGGASETGNAAAATAGTNLPRNVAGNRSDVAWKHGVSIDGGARNIRCSYCSNVVTGGVYRLKHHLAGTQKDVGACKSVPDNVKKEMWDIVSALQTNLIKKTSSIVEEVEAVGEAADNGKRKLVQFETPGSIFKKRGVSTQATISGILKKNLRVSFWEFR